MLLFSLQCVNKRKRLIKVNNIYVRIDNRVYDTKLGKCKTMLYRCIKKIKIEKIPNGKMFLIPQNYQNKIIKRKINKFIDREKNMNIIYSEEIADDLKWKKGLTNFDGKMLMKRMVFQILDYIYSANGSNKALDDIYIFVNKYSKENLYIIDRLVYVFKNVNIITANISKFKILERKYEKNNILITVLNNKRKSAKMAETIVNIDFDNDDFKKYVINNNAIVININKEKICFFNNFNGIIINDFNIEINQNLKSYIKEFYGNINLKTFIESITENIFNDNFDLIISDYNIKINELIGIRGTIDMQEFTRNYKMKKYA